MRFRINKKDNTVNVIDNRIDVPQEFKDLYKALAYIERNDWTLYDDSITELLTTVTKYDEYGCSFFDELYSFSASAICLGRDFFNSSARLVIFAVETDSISGVKEST